MITVDFVMWEEIQVNSEIEIGKQFKGQEHLECTHKCRNTEEILYA